MVFTVVAFTAVGVIALSGQAKSRTDGDLSRTPVQGLADWRIGKGSGSFGQFRRCNKTDPEFLDVVASGGRTAQVEAMANPIPFDSETADLLTWFPEELERRGKEKLTQEARRLNRERMAKLVGANGATP